MLELEGLGRATMAGIAVALVSGVMLLAQGCATPARLEAVPAVDTIKAEVPGMPGVRYVVPDGLAGLYADAQQSLKAELATRASAGLTGPLPPVNFLAISGGGDDGAYGVGLLCGWTVAGNRPEFKLVTGISTGALIAPFAFLGPKYDAALRAFYTGISQKDILEKRGMIQGYLKDALADNAPLLKLVQKAFTPEFLREIADEYAKGRMLLVGTTDLDARRPVIWNMTKIAASGTPQSLQLFQRIVVASAAIPAAFPPTMIDVEVDGKPYQEMHVDGGVSAQVFVYPASLKLKEEAAKAGAQRQRTLYVIRNSKLVPQWSDVERRTMSIAGRAISMLITTQGIGDMYRIYAVTQRDGVDFNFAYIPQSLNIPHKEDFDPQYMRGLFQVGYDAAVKGYSWDHRPPGM